MKEGNVLLVAMIFVAICIVVILFIATVFMSHVNTILYHFKLQMYTINQSAILSVNKTKASMDRFSYHTKTYQTFFEEALKENFELSDQWENKEKLIESVRVVEYEIIEKGRRDSFTREPCDDRVIHTVVELKIRPIILRQIFEKIFVFQIHEDVNLNMVSEK